MKARRGFALLAAIWLLVALSTIGLELSLLARERWRAVLNVVDEARARGVARAAIERARSRALVAGAGDDSGRIGDIAYRLTERDAGAALHLGSATEEELRRLLSALRYDFGFADSLAQAIADWRDQDDFHRERGAERAFYIEGGLRVLPANRPFRILRELLEVRGVTRAVYDSVSPFLTLIGSGKINLAAAPRPVLLALPGMTDAAVDALLSARLTEHRSLGLSELMNRIPSSAREALLPELPALEARTVIVRQAVEVESEAWVDGGGGRAKRVHIHALLAPAGSEMVVTWQRID